MIQKELENAGIDERESKVYLACLELGEAGATDISRKTGIKRTTVYLLIESLQEKGLIGSVKKGNRTLYVAEDPRKIVEKMDQRKNAIERVMPELLSMANVLDKKPKIKYFEEKRAVEEVYLDALFYPDQEMLSWLPSSYSLADKSFFNDFYIKKRIEKKIWLRAIAPDTEDMKAFFEKNQEELRQMKLVSQETFDVEVGIILYGKSKVGIVAYGEDMGLIIESAKIHRSLKNIFELAWNSLSK